MVLKILPIFVSTNSDPWISLDSNSSIVCSNFKMSESRSSNFMLAFTFVEICRKSSSRSFSNLRRIVSRALSIVFSFFGFSSSSSSSSTLETSTKLFSNFSFFLTPSSSCSGISSNSSFWRGGSFGTINVRIQVYHAYTICSWYLLARCIFFHFNSSFWRRRYCSHWFVVVGLRNFRHGVDIEFFSFLFPNRTLGIVFFSSLRFSAEFLRRFPKVFCFSIFINQKLSFYFSWF